MIDKSRITKEFMELAAIEAPTLGERRMADTLTAKLEAMGFVVTEDGAAEALGGTAGNLLATLPGTLKGEAILLAAHMDTVKPCAGKRAVMSPDGTICSAGDTVLGADDLSGVAEILAAVRSAIEDGRPRRDVEVLLTVSEEYFLKGSEYYDLTQCQARQGYVLDVDGAVGTAIVGAPTGIRFIANVKGKSAHAAIAPEEGVNAVAIAAKAIGKMRLGRIDPDTTASIGIIRGGSQGNIVPDQCFVEGETRSLDGGKAMTQCQHMKDCFTSEAERAGGTVEFEITKVYDAYRVPETSPVVQRFRAACEKCRITPILACSTGGSDNSMLSAKGLKAIVLASGMHEIHSVNEYTTADELAKMAAVVQEIICSEI